MGSSARGRDGALLFTGRSKRTSDKQSAGPTSATDLPHHAAQLASALCLSFPICKIGIMILILLCEALLKHNHLQISPAVKTAGT